MPTSHLPVGFSFSLGSPPSPPCCLSLHSQGDGHSFPIRVQSEAQNSLLANEEQWEEDGMEDGNQQSSETSQRLPRFHIAHVFLGMKCPSEKTEQQRVVPGTQPEGLCKQHASHSHHKTESITLMSAKDSEINVVSLPELTVGCREETQQDDNVGLNPVFYEDLYSLDHSVASA
ncbi:hypothetical protein E2320_012867 [Naja naja]|nr:hypothetical protein E2320_012867 [Naja naja]